MRPIGQVLSAYEYRESLIEKIVSQLKYGFAEELAGFMAARLSELWRVFSVSGTEAVVIAIPLHKRKLSERGFNQAELIGRQFAQKNSLAFVARALVRIADTAPQVGLSAVERAKNADGIFSVVDKGVICKKYVLLIDDVITTGATLNDAGRALAMAGAARITALTFARG